jgi:hypothetical protein
MPNVMPPSINMPCPINTAYPVTIQLNSPTQLIPTGTRTKKKNTGIPIRKNLASFEYCRDFLLRIS